MIRNKEKEVLRISKKGMEHEKMEMAHDAHRVLYAAWRMCDGRCERYENDSGHCGA